MSEEILVIEDGVVTDHNIYTEDPETAVVIPGGVKAIGEAVFRSARNIPAVTIPGTVQEDGTVNNTSAGSGTACTIMKSSKDKDAAWKFIKWWVSAETQYRYSAECEAVLGETGRVGSANIEGVTRMSWDDEALQVILDQWNHVEEIPEVPGSYYVGRSIDQAFWATKDGKSSSKEAIIDWAEICDKEIERKTQEYINVDPDA